MCDHELATTSRAPDPGFATHLPIPCARGLEVQAQSYDRRASRRAASIIAPSARAVRLELTDLERRSRPGLGVCIPTGRSPSQNELLPARSGRVVFADRVPGLAVNRDQNDSDIFEGGLNGKKSTLIRVSAVSADALIFEPDERGPDDDLKLQFEAVRLLPPEDRQAIKALPDGMIVKHRTSRSSGICGASR